jgi:hypothetical protein
MGSDMAGDMGSDMAGDMGGDLGLGIRLSMEPLSRTFVTFWTN